MPKLLASLLSVCAGLIALVRPADAAVKMLDHPAYPLYSVCGKVSPDMADQDLRTLALNFAFAHGKFTAAQSDKLHQFNPRFITLRYMNSTYTRPGDDYTQIEAHYRHAIAMCLAATLAAPIDAATTRLRLVGISHGKHGGTQPIPIRASTLPGNVSSLTDGTHRYVFWVRVDDEFMRVERFDPRTGEIEVTRGFDHTDPAAHPAGGNVFSPVYLGYKRAEKAKHPGNYPGGPGKCLRYVLDPQDPDSWKYKSACALQLIRQSHADGVWLDTLNTGDFNLSDCLGQHPKPWDFTHNNVSNRDVFRTGQERKINFMQNDLRGKIGRWPFLVANNMTSRSYAPGDGGLKMLLMPTKVKPRPLDGYCMEGALNPDHPEESWRDTIRVIMDAAQSGAAACPIWGNAGSKGVNLEDDNALRDRRERFAYASYLLAVEKDRKTYFGTYGFYTRGDERHVKLHPQYFYPIGDPAQTVKPDQLEQYRVPGTTAYRRRFTGGLVLVNPGDKPVAITLKTPRLDPDNHIALTQITLDAHCGKILLNP